MANARSPSRRPPPAVPDLEIVRLPIRCRGDVRRVITRPFFPGGTDRAAMLLERLDALPESAVRRTLRRLETRYGRRHRDLGAVFEEHYRTAEALAGWSRDWSPERRRLAGAYFTMEYAVDSAALFNPSIVAHPDQEGVPAGALRFVMSLRATGEGHISSIVFRTGVLGPGARFEVDPPPAQFFGARISPDRHYLKALFARKLKEMEVDDPAVGEILAQLPERFSLPELDAAVREAWAGRTRLSARRALWSMLWLARSNYQIELSPDADLAELVIYPLTEVESHGLEDLRLVRFTEDDGSVCYYGTYSAYDGVRVLPMLISTSDFRRLEIHSLNGASARDKGMALFPRRIDGHFAMCGRIDGENLFLMLSDYVHFWETAERIDVPRSTWGLMQLGNCGSPIETPEGWLVLIHGVGPMRRYAIGAVLLDLEDPRRVRGWLRRPLLVPVDGEREGYVPNVVYSCGALVHGGLLYLPYAIADKTTAVAVVDLPALLRTLLQSQP